MYFHYYESCGVHVGGVRGSQPLRNYKQNIDQITIREF